MDRKIFTANLNPKDPFNCYSNIIIERAKNVSTPNILFETSQKCNGISAGDKNPQKHHIYPRILFPITPPHSTTTIEVSEKRHLELHKLIAEERYAEYEAAIKAESSCTVTDNIKQIFLDRIASL